MEKEIENKLTSIVAEVRKDIIRMVGIAGSGPLELSLSIADILVYLYWEELVVLPNAHGRNDRDRLFMGIEKAVPALYSVLANRGYFDREELWHYRRLGAMLQALPDPNRTAGIDSTCLCSASELSLASPVAQVLLSIPQRPRVFCFCDDKDFSNSFFDEVSRTGKARLANLVLLIINAKNREGFIDNEMTSKHQNKFLNLGWTVDCVNGNSFVNLERVFSLLDYKNNKPKVIFVEIDPNNDYTFIESLKSSKPRIKRLQDIALALEELEENKNEK